MSSMGHNKSKLAPAQSQPVISVTSSSGSLGSGPTVGLQIRLADTTGLVMDMRPEEAFDLAYELLTAVRMSQRKYDEQFGEGLGATV